jgi:hypothetical protein
LKILFDQNVPRPLQRYLAAHDVKRLDQLGWSELKNGELLEVAEDAGFEVLLSGDKKLRFEQNMAGRRIAVVCMSDNHWPIVKDHVTAIGDAVDKAQPGTFTTVDCGTFVPRKLQKPAGPSLG